MEKKRILVAPLNWGLGHAARCIPIIKELQAKNFEPVIASDGAALEFLKKEFPHLSFFTLPSYNIRYSRYRFFFNWKLLLKAPHILKTISAEKRMVERLVRTENLHGIISDNRWGVRSKLLPGVFITHQVKVLSGFFTFFSSKIQQKYIRKFNECWIPDVAEEPSLSGEMGHPEFSFPVKFLGILSRFEKEELPLQFDITVILSGPEPQRSILEKILLKELKPSCSKILFVKGIIENEQKKEIRNNFTIYNFLQSKELERAFNSSNLIICRPGYTSLMDLAKLKKKLFVIPTPGQPEQEYLFKRLKKNGLAGGCTQKNFTLEKLTNAAEYEGLGGFSGYNRFGDLFSLFQSE